MIRSELISRLARRHPKLLAADVTACVDIILGGIAERLAQADGEGRVEIRGFGAFSLRLRPARQSRNPRTGEPVAVPARHAVHFRPGAELRERVACNG